MEQIGKQWKAFSVVLNQKLLLIKRQEKHVTYCILSEREFSHAYFCSDIVLAYTAQSKKWKLDTVENTMGYFPTIGSLLEKSMSEFLFAFSSSSDQIKLLISVIRGAVALCKIYSLKMLLRSNGVS